VSSRTLLSATLAGSLVRRNRRDDGRLFGVARATDLECGQPREWVVFVNDPALIEQFEKLKEGEPVAIAGPFAVRANGKRIEFRITADAIIGTRKQRKKRLKEEGNLLATVDLNEAPRDDSQEREPLNDSIPF
jgi:hypothetical protein